MPKPLTLSGQDVIHIFEHFGFVIVGRKGSHVKLRRSASNGSREMLTVPDHKELDRGTIVAIFKQGTRYISEAELRSHFYSD